MARPEMQGLTKRQREVAAIALASGYFESPRKVSLTRLAGLAHVAPVTLTRIIRGAERRLFQAYFVGLDAAAAISIEALAEPGCRTFGSMSSSSKAPKRTAP